MRRQIVAIASLVAFACGADVDNSKLDPLQFKKDGTFQIAIFSDMHFGQYESTTGPEQDRNSVEVLNKVLDYDTPDLVVLNGDLINGDSTWKHNSTHYIDMIVEPMVNRSLTWASTYGNHDHNYNINGDDILVREQMWPGARTQKMVNKTRSGTTNYYLPVYPSDCSNSSDCIPQMILWFFDSRGGNYYQGSWQENWVDQSVVDWFNETSTELTSKHNKTIPSLAFVHVPPNATVALQTELGIRKNNQPGINDDPPVPQQGYGWCADGTPTYDCPYGGQDIPFMEALVTIPGIIGLFYGHDHGNTWCYRWDTKLDGMDIEGNGIHLCYGQHSGYGGYGDWIRGAREIVVTEDMLEKNEVETYIRLESGDVVGKVMLNSTYNEDHYPATPNTMTYMSEEADSVSRMIKAVFFDFMGTCLDWHSSVVNALPPAIPKPNASELALEWRRKYFVANSERLAQRLEPEDIDDTLIRVLDNILDDMPDYKPHFNPEIKKQLIDAWHAQPAWPEVRKAIESIRNDLGLEVFVHANGTTRLQLDLTHFAGLNFNMLFSSQLLGTYKPDPEAYNKALRLVKLQPEEVVLVAAHAYDLRGAQAVGMKTIYIHRWTDDVDEDMEKVKGEFGAFLEGMEELPATIKIFQ
ncbi:hypothetical protein FAUST_7538 [Fusarium austroamericanum]|uniref:Calcineurin-like phosphoesterase domain-containing protein n=1 Tax=Fusarium austroamericanum TaxID=282268 RepID=A0AAN5Z6K3_FUSAU|nr:hypothetical protein FAUST_7538 [Fusarium austroamericanum]